MKSHLTSATYPRIRAPRPPLGAVAISVVVASQKFHYTALHSSCCHTEFHIIFESMEPQNIQTAPEIIQAIITQVKALGLSVDDYLRQIHGVMNGTPSPDSQALARPFYETATVNE